MSKFWKNKRPKAKDSTHHKQMGFRGKLWNITKVEPIKNHFGVSFAFIFHLEDKQGKTSDRLCQADQPILAFTSNKSNS